MKRVPVAALVILVTSSCARNTFDRQLAAGHWRDAAEAFAADSSLHTDERAMYRAALLYGSPDRDTFDPRTARALLQRLLEMHPNSIHRESAIRLIALFDEIERVRYDALARQQRLEAERDRLVLELERTRADLRIAESRLLAQGEVGRTLRQTVDRLQVSLRQSELRLQTLQDELDRLKAIDLRPPVAANPDSLRKN